jgi:tRNA nucleotidyltransferase (CCA-adding enzyme)
VGRSPSELDFVAEGPVSGIASALDPEARVHQEFGTAEVSVEGAPVDLAEARSETYPAPGALPVVESADLDSDLARRDFSINAIAVAVGPGGSLFDPFGGMQDLENGVLRILHEDSFIDDPTRAFRAARYCSRLDLSPDSETLSQLERTDISTVSSDRIDRELELIARELDPAAALILLSSWGLLDVQPDALSFSAAAFRTVRGEPWSAICTEREVIRGLLSPSVLDAARALVAPPGSDWDCYRAARSADPVTLVLAQAAGSAWVQRWPADWIDVQLHISGDDLIEAGLPEGPAVGAGLEAAMEDRLLNGDGGRERELSIALQGNGGSGPG